MSVLDLISGMFYDPIVFWGAPLVLALLHEACRRRLRRGGRH